MTSIETDSDDALMAAVARRDRSAFATLVQRHADAVYGYLLRMTGSRADTEDLTQETFLRLWNKAGTYRAGQVRLSTWLHRIAHNLAVDLFRREPQSVQTQPDEDLNNGTSLFEKQAATDTLRRLETALGRLPENQRAALLLCQTRGFSNSEAADILGINTRALESLLARARRTLRGKFYDSGDIP